MNDIASSTTNAMFAASAARKLMQARTALVLDEPFFGTLALRLKLVAQIESICPTMATDGVSAFYNPAWIETLTLEEVKGVLCHEVLHCSNGHIWRKGAREHDRANAAMDYAINPIVVDSGFRLPKNPPPLLDAKYNGWPFEQIYDDLPHNKQQPQSCGDVIEPANGDNGDGDSDGDGQDGQGQGQPKPGANPSPEQMQADWQIATLQAAAIAKSQGKLPGALSGLIAELKRNRVDWKSALRKFVQQTAKSDYSMRRPNRRYIAHGLYLHGLYSEALPPIVVAVDSSGSVWHRVPEFCAEINAIADECKPERVHVINCDAEIQSFETYEQGEQIKMEKHGGGGTDFRPVFELVEREGIEPACLIYLTDLYGTFPDVPPSYPVLWATVDNASGQVPFGEALPIDQE